MIVFRCPCHYMWILDLESATAIGPIHHKGLGEEYSCRNTGPYIGNQEKAIAFDYLRDMYGDCWAEIQRRVTGK